MKLLTFSLLALGLFMQQPNEAYPGQRSHQEPPNGWYCVPTDTTERMEKDAHACDCLGMISDPMCTTHTENEDGEQVEIPATGENQKCRSFCWPQHCTCKRLCKDTRAKAPAGTYAASTPSLPARQPLASMTHAHR